MIVKYHQIMGFVNRGRGPSGLSIFLPRTVVGENSDLPFTRQTSLIDYIFCLRPMNSGTLVHEMRGTQFPFGVLKVEEDGARKAFVKKRYFFKDEDEYDQLKSKIDKLKNISHKNTINLRSTEEGPNSITLVYQYVTHSMNDSFMDNPNQTVKEMHRQFIELAIYLAKNCIVTAFNPERCGMVVNENRSTLKYYLPLPDINITDNRTTLQRSVQLFNVQSMHFLDTLINLQDSFNQLNTTFNQSESQRTFKNRVKLFPSAKPDKQRRESQPTGFFTPKDRKLSSIPTLQYRKLSSLSKEFSEISQKHTRNRASTRGSGGSFNTFHSIMSLKSTKEVGSVLERTVEVDASKLSMRRCLSQNGLQDMMRIQNVINRSKRALVNLQKVRQNLKSYRGLFEVIKRLHNQN